MNKTFYRIGCAAIGLGMLVGLSACENQSIYESKQIDTEPTAYSMELSREQLTDMIEKNMAYYRIFAGLGSWPEARDALQTTLIAYNTLIDKFYDDPIASEAMQKVHSMKLGGSDKEVKLDSILQECGVGSRIRIGMYEVGVHRKEGGEGIDAKNLVSDNAVTLSLHTNGEEEDLHWIPGKTRAEFNTTQDDIYLSDLVELANKYRD